MPLTRSYNKAVATIQTMGQDLVDRIICLADYLKGLVTSEHPDWMNHIRDYVRWILEKITAFCHRVAWALGCKKSSLAKEGDIMKVSSSAKEDILKAVEMAKLQTTNLMYGIKASISETLEAVKTKIMGLKENNDTDEEESKEEEAKEEEDEDHEPPSLAGAWDAVIRELEENNDTDDGGEEEPMEVEAKEEVAEEEEVEDEEPSSKKSRLE